MKAAWRISIVVALGALGLRCGSSEDPEGSGGSGGSGPPIACPPVDAGFDEQNPVVSFAGVNGDGTGTNLEEGGVLWVFRRGCGFSSCHGDPLSPKAELYLGPNLKDPLDPADTAAIVASIANQPSLTAPALDLVEPGDWANSFLMLKLDGCHGESGLTCNPQPGSVSGEPCGDLMPRNGVQLSESERNAVRRWIAQGAQDN